MIVLLVLVCLVFAIGGGLVFFTARTVRKVETALPPAGRFVEVPGARLHVVERGSGPVSLLVHGLAGQLGHFTSAQPFHRGVRRFCGDSRRPSRDGAALRRHAVAGEHPVRPRRRHLEST
jgi:hypothetical protein